jgi:putative tryptophan/tyrosine transport system substrate-binding protein
MAGSLLAAPLATEALQAGKIPTIGFLWATPRVDRMTAAFEQGLRDWGWLNGQNIAIKHRFAEGHFDRLPALAAELVGLRVDVIVADAAPATKAAKRATRSIPIVFAVHGDPIGAGDIGNLSHPGGNITGLTLMHPELIGKQLDLLKQAVPRVSRVAVLWNAANPAKILDWRELKPAARTLGIALQSREVRRPADFDAAFAAIRDERPDGLLTLGDALTFSGRVSITDFAANERLPALYQYREFVEGGGLMSYGADLADSFRRAAAYVDKILKGAKPADLPIEQPTKFELVINLKTAKALGLIIPPSLLARADEIIQ